MSTVAQSSSLVRLRKDEDREAETHPLELGLIVRILQYTRKHARLRNWLFALVILRSIQLPSLTWVLAAVIDGPVVRGDSQGVMLGALGFLLLAIFTQFVMHFRQRYAYELGEAVVQDMRNELFAHLQRMPMSFYNRTKLGRIISRVTSDVESVRVGVQEILFVGIVQCGQMIVAAAFMLWCDPFLFSLLLALAPVLWGINRYFRQRLSNAHRDVQESFSRVTATLAESVNGVRVTQGFVRQETNARMFHDLVSDHSQYNLTVARMQGMFIPLLDMNTQLFMALLLIVGGYHAIAADSEATLGSLVWFFFMANVFFSPINVLGQLYDQALTAMAGAERVFRLIDAKPDWTDEPDALDLPAIRGEIEFRDVTFEYLPDRPVLHDLSFKIPAGATVALVGHTGSGKTTISSLLAKFYQPTSGQVLIDGHDLRRVTSSSLHKQIGLVLQHNFLFSGSVMDNIRFAKPEASDEEVRDALRQLDCLDLLEALPQGLDTPVGERGGNLSLGQRQLACFARAMLADPRILILDEATSNVDTITEARVQHALHQLVEGRTSVIVAHRLSTIRHADIILVMQDGRLVERGRHAELLAAGGVYASLYRNFVRSARNLADDH